MKKAEKLKEEIIELVRYYYYLYHKPNISKKFDPDTDFINYAGRVFDEEEIINLVDASLEFWLTGGRYTDEFEKGLADFLSVKYCLMVNSGSSANLLAFMALTSHELGDRKIERGDEVITVAAGFPTTIAPIVQYGAVPVFVDIEIPTYNIDISQLEEALSNRTKAVFIAHTLGNPFNVNVVKEFCNEHKLWLIEDNCDALGSRYLYKGEWKYTGTIGDVGTSSFYPAHHITTGEGGAVYTNDKVLNKIMLSLRDWGRACWCPTGKDNSCRKRFSWQLGELPYGYDHKYTYSHLGYNLKATDLQAAIGSAQLKKLPSFIEKRKRNWKLLMEALSEFEEFFILPECTENSDPSWFGFVITLRDSCGFSRDEIVKFLETNKIQTRFLFAGNVTKHPAFDELRLSGKGYRIVGSLKNTDKVLNDTFWIGVYPKIGEEMIDYIAFKIKEFIRNGSRS
ncbi:MULTISPECIES: lipopolysaccharide biosynthesis protein RfbH [Thermodesulfovibrio]|uniref:lipopolysaccharide biosynthesis protein RfbH n=1 Tax=Thermodesulfovibrio yellowstonii TaxID=28262 RepID=UPI0004226204|nr:lipopolysaccharide biosynthesis protein RfbH [Thermodesulfovibrio islandicus]